MPRVLTVAPGDPVTSVCQNSFALSPTHPHLCLTRSNASYQVHRGTRAPKWLLKNAVPVSKRILTLSNARHLIRSAHLFQKPRERKKLLQKGNWESSLIEAPWSSLWHHHLRNNPGKYLPWNMYQYSCSSFPRPFYSPWEISLLLLLPVSFCAFLLLNDLVAWATAGEEEQGQGSGPVVCDQQQHRVLTLRRRTATAAASGKQQFSRASCLEVGGTPLPGTGDFTATFYFCSSMNKIT